MPEPVLTTELNGWRPANMRAATRVWRSTPA
jgi:hypothetical protein